MPIIFANVIIDKVSQFYIDLKRQKALADYNFTLSKIDSLQAIVNVMDNKSIKLEQTTFFTPLLLQYSIPKSNLVEEKSRIARQRDGAISNRDEALWRLQKLTPIISVLDKPTPPFDSTKPSPLVYAILGFCLGSIMIIFLLLRKLIAQFVKSELRKNIFGTTEPITD